MKLDIGDSHEISATPDPSVVILKALCESPTLRDSLVETHRTCLPNMGFNICLSWAIGIDEGRIDILRCHDGWIDSDRLMKISNQKV